MRVAICDDDSAVLAHAKKYIENYAESGNVSMNTDVFDSPGELIAVLSDNGYRFYDIVFLDISMPPASGLDIAAQIRQYNLNLPIVFMTGYSDHMPEAFHVHAFEYILKPVSQNKITKVLDDYYRRNTLLTVVSDRYEVCVPTNDILYIESLSKRALIKTFGKDYYAYESQESLLTQLPNCFVQCHKSYIVNLDKIIKRNPSSCELLGGFEIPVGRKHFKSFRDTYYAYLLIRGERG
jgi:DNA-binding LytR/AlgR family response regulator